MNWLKYQELQKKRAELNRLIIEAEQLSRNLHAAIVAAEIDEDVKTSVTYEKDSQDIFVLAGFDSVEDAEDFIIRMERIDPDGVRAGYYGINRREPQSNSG